ncbi:hypothetical protein [Poseidonibacter lekithochrous]|uniref:hypothetical protein n=1 Tax=Poseidonibacter lekithochrous TaxID=1904463 RepID=UPI00196A592D|nr:hypothetical protein [Poseidonibacter lekithochrous]
MDINTLLPIFTAVIGSYLTYYFASKSKRNESILKYKEEKYSNLLILLQGFVGNTANAETKKKFFEEQYKSWLYCSDEVVESINTMVKLVVESNSKNIDPEDGRKAIGNIVVAMRKDLLGKTKLSYSNFKYTDVLN